jgi:lipoyl(octanoyl) transferase
MSSIFSQNTLYVRQLGRQPYEPIFDAMKEFTDTRDESTVDEVWLVDHDPVFTQGQAGKPEHILLPGNIPVVKVDRGGQITYHGPGQIVGYPMLDIKRKGMGVRNLVTNIENSIVGVLAELGIESAARSDAPGVYVGDTKIASLGLRIRKGKSYHGLALNVDMDLSPFQRINPCGYQGLQMTQVKRLLEDRKMPSYQQVEEMLLDKLADHLGFQNWQYIEDPCSILNADIKQSEESA